jgi:hypothetical protein
MTDRTFPLSPRSSRDLEVGDFWAVSLPDGSFGACQVCDLKRSGVGALKTLVVGVIDWRGNAKPTELELAGRRILAQGLTRIELFTQGGAQVIGSTKATVHGPELKSAFRDHGVGTVTEVWGWKVVDRRVVNALDHRG